MAIVTLLRTSPGTLSLVFVSPAVAGCDTPKPPEGHNAISSFRYTNHTQPSSCLGKRGRCLFKGERL